MRLLYSFFWLLFLPIAFLRLWLRSRQESGYAQHWGERLARYPRHIFHNHPCIWLHAVSAGETRASAPLVRLLLDSFPQHRIVITHMTPMGRATSQALFAEEMQDSEDRARIMHAFIPYDLGFLMRRFIRYFQPRICILVETEVWPNLIHQCQKQNVPVTLVNARLSEKSLRKALKFESLFRPAAQAMNCIVAQSHPDAERLKSIGATEVVVTGNMKFDVNPPSDLAAQGLALRKFLQANRPNHPIFIAGSTREGEEALLINAFIQMRDQCASQQKSMPLLILTPRHPQRFDEVAQLLKVYGISFIRRSEIRWESDEARSAEQVPFEVLLGDSMGEMYMYYAASDIAFIGGSLAHLGGHNLIEAFAMHKPVIVGPHTFNFSEITQQALHANIAYQVNNADEVFQNAMQLLEDASLREQMGHNAHAFFLQHQGATLRTLTAISPWIK